MKNTKDEELEPFQIEILPKRELLGNRNKSRKNETKQRFVTKPKVPILDVAAFNSFIG